jgi:NAD(P)-dependent dehydrogenase (short-subunit alcohol dehydrogenase family)
MSSSIPTQRAAIVTGAAQGIGRAIALRLAQDGYDMALNDLSRSSAALETLAEEIKAKGRKAIVVHEDISKEEVVQALVDQTVADLGELYIVR